VNPELLRNLWLEMTAPRLVAAPAILVLLLFAAETGGARASVAFWAAAAMLLLYAPRLAARSLIAEVASRTWDFQRASALGAWQLATGKLFGGTAFAWYTAAVAALLSVFVPGVRGPWDWAQLAVAAVVATGVALMAALLAVRSDPRPGRSSAFGPQLLGLACGLLAVGLLAMAHVTLLDVPYLRWWGRELEPALTMALATVFAAFAVLGSWRLMAEVLQIPAGGGLWPAFLLWLGVFGAGFADEPGGRIALAFCAILPAAYVAALADPRSAVLLRRWRADLAAGRMLRAWRGLPPWLLAAVVLVGLASLLPHDVVALTFGSAGDALRFSAWPLVLLFLRDVALMYLVAPGRAGLAVIVVWLAVAYAVLPSVVASLEMPEAVLALLPVPVMMDEAWWQLPSIAAQAALFAALAWLRSPAPQRT
jgi:hypothetical protein